MGDQRQIDGLVWVRLGENPWEDIRRPRVTGARAKGKAYEKKAATLVSELAPAGSRIIHHPWFEFRDQFGNGAAEPDYLVVCSGVVYIFEIKLTQSIKATAQLRGLYGPLVKRYYTRPVALIEVFKHMQTEKGLTMVNVLSEVKPNEKVHTIHWLP